MQLENSAGGLLNLPGAQIHGEEKYILFYFLTQLLRVQLEQHNIMAPASKLTICVILACESITASVRVCMQVIH